MVENIKNIEALRLSLDKFGIKSPSQQDLFLQETSIFEYKKNHIIFHENKINASEYIVLEGVLHRCNFNNNDDIITTGFYMAVVPVTPHTARTIKGRSIFTLQTLTDVKIAEIPVSALNHLRFTTEEYRNFGQRIIEAELSRILFNDISYRSLSARERLSLLRKNFPNIENLINHNIIASYLGITNVSFSRIRSENR